MQSMSLTAIRIGEAAGLLQLRARVTSAVLWVSAGAQSRRRCGSPHVFFV